MAGNNRTPYTTLRWSVLLAFLILSTGIGLIHSYNLIPRFMSGEAICPFGALESSVDLIRSGVYMKRTGLSNFILLGGVLVLALVFRRSFCGVICPLGTLQDLSSRLRGLFGIKRREIPRNADRVLRYLKYAVLAGFLTLTWRAGEMVIRPYDPWVAWNHLTSDELLTEMGIGLGVLILSLAGSFLYDRFFCKYLCPMGAFLGLISRLSVFQIRRNADNCLSCGKSSRASPVNLDVDRIDTLRSAECLSCGLCVDACPVDHTLEFSRGSRKIRPALIPLVSAAVILLLVSGTSLTGDFLWADPSLEQTVEQAGGSFDPDMIKGKLSLEEISEVYGIPRDVIMNEFGVAPEQLPLPMKEFKDDLGFSMEDIRIMIARELGVEYAGEEE